MPANPESFQKIQHFVVLMLENRSFDHLIGSLRTIDPRVAGFTGNEFNYEDPNSLTTPVAVRKATSYVMPFDPPHEFLDVQMQLYGPKKDDPLYPQPPTEPAPIDVTSLF
jgi:phospholipase C